MTLRHTTVRTECRYFISEAFEIIRKDIGTAFEIDIVKAFFTKQKLYPINTIVELSGSRLVMVLESERA